MRRKYNFGDSACIDCGVVYQKTGTRQQRCKRCADVANAIRRKKHQDIYLPQHREEAARRANAWYYANKKRHATVRKKNYDPNIAKEYNAKYRINNKSALNEYDKKRNKERKEQTRLWRDKNKAKIEATSKEWRKRNPERARIISVKAAMKRMMRKRGLLFEYVNRAEIYKEQAGICALCGLSMTTSKYEIDHIIPLSKGGPHIRSNLQATHVTCNRKKYNKLIGENGNDGLVI